MTCAKIIELNGKGWARWSVFYQKSPHHYVLEGGAELYKRTHRNAWDKQDWTFDSRGGMSHCTVRIIRAHQVRDINEADGPFCCIYCGEQFGGETFVAEIPLSAHVPYIEVDRETVLGDPTTSVRLSHSIRVF